MSKIAIIGAGFSGLVLANELKTNRNFEITFFEKSRGIGGRMATRYNEKWEFDHGTPFFEAKNSQFVNFLQPLIQSDIIAKWRPKITNNSMIHINDDIEYYIGTPKINSLPKALSNGFNIQFETKITKMERQENKWHLTDDQSRKYGGFDFIITSTPPAQTYDILPDSCSYKGTLPTYEMLPQFVCLFGFDELKTNFDIMQVQNSKIETIVLNHTKNGRSSKPSVVVYSSVKWSEENVNMDKNEVGRELLSELEHLLNTTPQMIQTHRWLYSRPKAKSDLLTLVDHNLNIFSCGDWLSTGTIEGAFLSGIKTINHILEK
jgi:renalase